MTDTQRARELLAAELEQLAGCRETARLIRGGSDSPVHLACLRAIEAALATLPGQGIEAAAREEALAMLQDWLKDTPRYDGDDPRANHYRSNVRALETAIRALNSGAGR